ncbi:disease resistance protein RPV1-like [Vitis riparia]|uniref:disease resistance protein RPV1-like n=1 Tax=Vitis riparia TaxID=96939 RepID=UPI00155A0D57|nr:disease resistance protein RPV1-like [Vitis riparia]XP_034691603.1 disease resistance protein RPV1-like [Vitis riparia]
MASTSAQMASDSSPSNLGWTHDVFLSFRGEDTRYNFTDHLYNALVRKGIITFRDDQLPRGEKIAPELLNAIEKSRSSIVVFSKTYADSRWCLDELAKIMECSRKYGQIVLPIFYHVDPSDVRKQTGRFGEAFTKYEENWKNKVQSWREALTEASNISGWDIVNKGYESEHINNITTTIANRILNRKLLFVGDNLVGMDSHFRKISLRLSMESNDVRMVGICGIGGIGKTTIAGYIYNQISWRFECISFLDKAKVVYKNEGLLHLQNQLLNDILGDGNQKISNIYRGVEVIKNSLYFRKALIVFDDVDIDDIDQLEFLVGNHTWYGKGSRIIITTRDKQCLTKLNVDYLYEVERLESNEALELFSQHAFRSNLPKEGFENLLDHVIGYCDGLPLALNVLGSLLCNKTKREWESALHKLEKEPVERIQNVLKISFDGLDTTQQMILLDIACFFQGEDKDFASKIWDGYELYGEINIRVLTEKCLITISNNKLHMHGLIEKMCKKIVREQHPNDPRKWSRLWTREDIYRAFVSEKGMKNVETISLELSRSKEKWFTTKIFAQMKKVFAKMKKLRLLKVYYSHGVECKTRLPKGFEFPPNLNYLHWEGLVSSPSNFHGEKLVAISLKNSNIKELLIGEKCLAELKFIDLSNSRQLIKIPKLSRMPELEILNLGGCVNFCKLHSSIGKFFEMKILRVLNFSESGIRELPCSIGSLISLDLSKCSKFEKFPDNFFVNMRHLKWLRLSHSGIKELPTSIECLEALVVLWLDNCSNFEKFPEIQKNMENLYGLVLSDTPIKELSCWMGHFPRLRWLPLIGSKNLRSVPSSILQLKSLRRCNLDGCSNLEIFSEIMEDMEHSKGLSLRESAIRMATLDLSNCENLETLPNSIGMTCVSELTVRNCPKLHKLPDSLRSMQLKVLDIRGCNLMAGAIPDDLWCLFSLESLNVSRINIDCIPGGIIHLSRLHILEMHHCLMLKEIPKLPSSLRWIEAQGCPLLETLSSDAKHPLWSSLHNCLKSHIQDYFECPPYWKYYGETRVVIPGSRGIPEWISHKSMGDEITIDLPKNWYEDNNFLGFALFSHYAPVDDDIFKAANIRIASDSLRLLISDGDQFGHVEKIMSRMIFSTLFPNPALRVVYFPQSAISSEYRSNRWNKFKTRFSALPNEAFKVKSCGIHLIYDHGQDHPQ